MFPGPGFDLPGRTHALLIPEDHLSRVSTLHGSNLEDFYDGCKPCNKADSWYHALKPGSWWWPNRAVTDLYKSAYGGLFKAKVGDIVFDSPV